MGTLHANSPLPLGGDQGEGFCANYMPLIVTFTGGVLPAPSASTSFSGTTIPVFIPDC